MILRLAATTLLLAFLGSVPVLAQDQSSVQRGRAVAERRCAACHGVQAGDTVSPNAAAASFPRVAATPGMTELALQATLQTSHRTMPNLILDVEETRDVIAYAPATVSIRFCSGLENTLTASQATIRRLRNERPGAASLRKRWKRR